MSELEPEEVLDALDETPQTAERLARRLEREPEAVQAALEEAREQGTAVDWGRVWATTWRAKLRLAPRFFKIWIPASIALGAGLTATALALHTPAGVGWQATMGLGVLALAAGTLALVPWMREASG